MQCEKCAEEQQQLQRKADGRRPDTVPPIVNEVLSSPGQPLDMDSRAFMENRFGYDFSSVRVHSGSQAERSADAVNAEAYTVGRDIVFAGGRYSPGSESGKQLLAHELAHVVQQDASASTVSSEIPIVESAADEAHADVAAARAMQASASVEPAASGSSGGLQKKDASDAQPQAAKPTPRIEAIVGEDIPSLLQAGALTIIEFTASWCGPCQQIKAGLEDFSGTLAKAPPGIPVRIYTIDVDATANKAAADKYAPGSVPHLYVYVGATERVHINQGVEPDALVALLAEQLDYASTAGWWYGAKKGAKWGLIPGAVAGLVGAGFALASDLEGNAKMGGVLGALGGGLLAGALVGGAIGAIAGAVNDPRKTGPKDQKRKKLQPKRRNDSTASLEKEADRAATAVNAGERAQVQQRSDQQMLRMTRGEKAWAGAGIGALAGGATGVLAGLGVAAATGGRLATGALIGGLVGGAVGALVGALAGFFSPRRTTPEGIAEAEALIQKHYGRYLHHKTAGPLHDARVHVVSTAELQALQDCRHHPPDPNASRKPAPPASSDSITVGWTDTGVPLKPAQGPNNQPAPIASADQEPVCDNGKRLEHATQERPVIYYVRDSKYAGTLIHEGLHAHSQRDYEFLHNFVVEGTTEYFTRKLQDQINMPYVEGPYDDRVKEVEKLVKLVGEETVARAYFGGAVPELHRAVNAELGSCGLAAWALFLAEGSDSAAQAIMDGRHQNYCDSKTGGGGDPRLITPGAPPHPPENPGGAAHE
jgi:thiol-disulfide isomerase/thioredoxin